MFEAALTQYAEAVQTFDAFADANPDAGVVVHQPVSLQHPANMQRRLRVDLRNVHKVAVVDVIHYDTACLPVSEVPEIRIVQQPAGVAHVAQEVANGLIAAGILAILNFAPIILQVPDNVVVNNVDLAIELENLSYFIQ